MKSPAAYYLFLLYMFALCKPVMPLVQDVIAHTFFEHQHLESVHKDGGKNHVNKEVGKLAGDESSSNSNSLKSYDDVAPHLITAFEFFPSSLKPVVLSHYSQYNSSLSTSSLAIQLPPPRR